MTTQPGATALPPTVTARTTPSGLDVLTVSTVHGTAEVYLQGAHVTAWTPAGEAPVLWLSSASAFEPGVPIRGGIPLCYPWFGPLGDDPAAPAHGFARRVPWTLVDVTEPSTGETVLTFTLRTPGSDDLPGFGAALDAFAGLEARYVVTVGPALSVALTVTNLGESAVTFEEAQHTYLRVHDVETTRVAGLEDVGFSDKTAASAAEASRDPEGATLVPTGQVDRVYRGTTAPVRVDDGERTLVVAKTGSESTVVWSPGAAVAAGMADMGPGEWRQMLCVETCNVGEHAVTLAPGESHTLGSTYTVVRGD